MDQNQLNLAAEHAREVITEIDGNIAIITMNRPEKLNGWTMEMMEAFKAAFVASDARDDVKAIIFTGTGKYFSAGANLSGVFRPMAPRALFDMIVDHNQALFDIFIDCKTPVLVAINGHAIGATVTSAALCDGVIAVDDATFSTPFKALGITPEGCSTEVFPALMGKDNADRMLGAEGWKPTAAEAVDAGLVDQAVPPGELIYGIRISIMI